MNAARAFVGARLGRRLGVVVSERTRRRARAYRRRLRAVVAYARRRFPTTMAHVDAATSLERVNDAYTLATYGDGAFAYVCAPLMAELATLAQAAAFVDDDMSEWPLEAALDIDTNAVVCMPYIEAVCETLEGCVRAVTIK